MTLDELKRKYPGLIKQIEDGVLEQLGIFGDKGNKGLTEEETPKLTEGQKKQIRTSAKMAAGIDL